jgi:hypothetical protein
MKKRTMQKHILPGQARQGTHLLFARRKQRHEHHQSGAALIISLAILMVLLSLAITFILIVRFETYMANQTHQRTRSEHLLDGAIAQAQYRLNRDLEVHPDALSLDHGWRSWFNGASVIGKNWANYPIPGSEGKRSIAVNLAPVELVLRDPNLLRDGMLYVQFKRDWHVEPLFRGPRTESWLHVPRWQGDDILLFTSPEEIQLINNTGTVLHLNDLNIALELEGRPERFHFLNEKTLLENKNNPNYYPFVTPAFMKKDSSAPTVDGLLPQEVVNQWADVDSNGDGMRDAIWMPMAREINHCGDGIDNDLDGQIDPIVRDETTGDYVPAFESAPFVYFSGGLPLDMIAENAETIHELSGLAWNNVEGRWRDEYPVPDGGRLVLTIPLPGLFTQVDINGDGVFNEEDWYVENDADGRKGPLFVRLPDTLHVPVTLGVNSDGSFNYGRVPVTLNNVDSIDNDYDLIVNNFRSYAYVGAEKNNGMHNINLDAILPIGRAQDLQFYCTFQNGNTNSVSYNQVRQYFLNTVPLPKRVDIHNLRLSCSGEPVSEIVGRYAIHITDEASKANLNAHGAYAEGKDGVLRRSNSEGWSPFEYETRLIPIFGVARSPKMWHYRTGFDGPAYNGANNSDFQIDGRMPGYGLIDDDGNALLASLQKRDITGDGWTMGDWYVPPYVKNKKIADYITLRFDNVNSLDTLFNNPPRPEATDNPLWARELASVRNSFLRIGRFQGIDEPEELRMYNPLHNIFADQYSDRLFLRKEYLQRIEDFGQGRWNFLQNLVTVNSERRNSYSVQGTQLQQLFLEIDPNYATPQQLAITLFAKANTTNILDSIPMPSNVYRAFAEGLRQFDTAFVGDIMGEGRDVAGNGRFNPGLRFPADPVLQSLRLSVEAVAARDTSFGRRKLVTEGILQAKNEVNLAGRNLPPELLNERERKRLDELMPVSAVQEYLFTNLGLTEDTVRLTAWDPWWKDITGEDRNFEYATASMDAIRINELMVRPVRRVEAEMLPLEMQNSFETNPVLSGYNVNLDPAPYVGMPVFDMSHFPFDVDQNKWSLRSFYNDQPLLGDRTAWVFEASNTSFDLDSDSVLDSVFTNPEDLELLRQALFGESVSPALEIMEFDFASPFQEANHLDPPNGLPAGRYYLTMNVTDQYGNMTVADPDVLQYAIKYRAIFKNENEEIVGGGDTIVGDVRSLYDPLVYNAVDAVNFLFKNVDKPEYIATTEARDYGSAAAPGWVFLPNTELNIEDIYHRFNQTLPMFTYWEELATYIGSSQIVGDESAWKPVFSRIRDWFDDPDIFDPPLPEYTEPTISLQQKKMYFEWLAVNYPDALPDPGIVSLLRELVQYELLFQITPDYFRDDIPNIGEPSSRTYTVVVPPPPMPDPDNLDNFIGYRLSVAVRMSPTPRGLFVSALDDWLDEAINEVTANNALPAEIEPLPQPKTLVEYLYVFERVHQMLLSQAGTKGEDFSNRLKQVLIESKLFSALVPPRLAINFFDFSQEPDHEYVELANISEEVVDVSGWRLEVGIPAPMGVEQNSSIQDPYKSVWKIPANTTVAPGGFILLAFGEEGSGNLLATNKMGLLANNDPSITVPPMADVSNDSVFAPLTDLTGSVFDRRDGYEYIDNDGDGLSSANFVRNYDPNDISLAQLDVLDSDRYLSEVKSHNYGETPPAGLNIPAGTRIVRLENERLWAENARFSPPLAWEQYDPVGSDLVNIRMENIEGEEGLVRLARLVLRGGILPNYPEQDGIDNDGDGAYVIKDPEGGIVRFLNPHYAETDKEEIFEPLMHYVPGALDKDMIDNNLNYALDERGNEIFNINTGYYLRHGNPLRSEGVDEGRLGTPLWHPDGYWTGFRGFLAPESVGLPRFYGHGSYEGTPLPIFAISNKNNDYTTQYRERWIRPLLNDRSIYYYSLADGYFASVDSVGSVGSTIPENGFYPFKNDALPYLDLINTDSIPTIAYGEDSPDWQAFVERRWNPGDNVMVTLYVGHPDHNRIADQVSYREYDVINRTLDDIVPSPYVVDGFSNYESDALGQIVWRGPSGETDFTNQVCLHPPALFAANDPGKPTFWLPNHMGLDFYRSLERKHPLYHGDRFGTTNRWTPTDGAYDDWADSMSLFQSGLGAFHHLWDPDGGESSFDAPGITHFYDNTTGRFTKGTRFVFPRFKDALNNNPFNERRAHQLFGHALYGSPLRMNTQARLWENPPDLASAGFALNLNDDLDHNYNQRVGHQFAGLDAYRNTGHDLIQRNFDLGNNGLTQAALERRPALDWALRNIGLKKSVYNTPVDLATLPFLSFERIIEGPRFNMRSDGHYFPRMAVSPLNTRYFALEMDNMPVLPNVSSASGDPRSVFVSNDILRVVYGYDPDLSAVYASQAVQGGGISSIRVDKTSPDPDSLAAEVIAVSTMDPVVLTVGQARVVPIWPALPDAYNPITESAFDVDELRALFQSPGNSLPHNWTPVFLLDLPMQTPRGPELEIPWQIVNYPRRIYPAPNPPVAYRLPASIDSLIKPRYIFNGDYYIAKYFPDALSELQNNNRNNIDNYLADNIWPRWPVPRVASIYPETYENTAAANRAVMYVSKYDPIVGEQNRPEALFVWDSDSGLENGSYIAYVGTFIPGMEDRLRQAESLSDLAQVGLQTQKINLLHNSGSPILNLDPDSYQSLQTSGKHERFAPRLAFELITNRRDAERMRDRGLRRDPVAGVYGLAHPADWGKEGDGGDDRIARGQVERPDKEGILLYSAGASWQPIPVHVTDNFLALRVRNNGSPSEIACVTRVILAPAPRTRGVVNINTAETQRPVVTGAGIGSTAANWGVELFNVLMGLPGVSNVLNVTGDRNLPPYDNAALGLPHMEIPTASYPNLDPFRKTWSTGEELEMLYDLWGTTAGENVYRVPPLRNQSYPLLAPTEQYTPNWSRNLHGRALLRLVALMLEGREEHPDGRYYKNQAELMDGIFKGGLVRADHSDGPWPLSNLGIPGGRFIAPPDAINPVNIYEARFEEIIERLRRMGNTLTTRSDVFEIIATVQSGNGADFNNDGLIDYRGGEFSTQNELRGRIIYDRRARAIRQDEKRE